MARDTKRMALYEAIRKGQTKPGKTVSFRSPRAAARRWSRAQREHGYPRSGESGASGGNGVARLREFLARRVDLSMSYLAAGLLLVALLVVLAGAVRIGQMYPDRVLPFLGPKTPAEPVNGKVNEIKEALFVETANIVSPRGGIETARERLVDTKPSQPVAAPKPVVEEKVEIVPAAVVPAVTEGNNRIVIQAYFQSRDLIPVQQHFAQSGVATEILERRSYFFLVTTGKYHGFGPDSDGAVALEKIKKVGANYQAPGGYESFRPNLFQDAYGERVG
jgi:hypothetical protein